MTLKVVPLRESPLLNDLPGKMREFADRYERGEVGPFETLMVVGVYPSHFSPYFACWGDNPDRHATAGVMLHCANLALTEKSHD